MIKNILWLLIGITSLTFRNDIVASGTEVAIKGQNSIQEIPPNGIVISEPGTYFFVGDLKWHPTSDATAITIQANDVTLNLKGHTLKSCSSGFKTVGISAIASERVKIINGKIQNMGVSGVECKQCIDVLVKGVTIDGLRHNDTVNFTVPTGILSMQCINVHVDKCTIKNIDVQTASTAAIQFTSTIASRASNCRIKNLLNRDGACSGIGHLFCDQAVVESCKIDKIQTKFIDNLNTTGHTAIGLVPFLSTNLSISDCAISNVTGCCDDAHGISLFVCDKATVRNCKVSDVIDGVGPSHRGAKATGIEVYASEVEVSDCCVKNITAINPEDKQATGFSSAVCFGVKFLRCKAENVKVFDESGKYNDSLGYGTGFGWAPDPRPEFLFPAVDILYQDCVAQNCQVGFDSWYHINSVWDHIVSICNEIPILNLGDDAQRTISCSPCSECGCTEIGCWPVPFEVTLTNVATNNTFLHVKEKKCRSPLIIPCRTIESP